MSRTELQGPFRPNLMTPSFEETTLVLGLGAPRTGTKWMSRYFAEHPQILMSPIRVLHYFDARYDPEAAKQYNKQFEDRLRRARARREDEVGRRRSGQLENMQDRVRMITDESAYIDYFRKRWSGEKVFSDITPSYCTLGPDAFREMFGIHKKVLFLFVIRNPIDRFWSGLRLKHMRDQSFDVLEAFDRRIKGGQRDEASRQDYKRTILNLESVVPRSVIKCIFFEELFNMDAVDELCRFLGVETVRAPVETAVNQSDPMPLDLNRRRLCYPTFESDYRFIHDRFGGKLPRSWLEDMDG